MACGVGGARHHQDRPQDRADAGDPAGGKGHPHQEGPQVAAGVSLEIQMLLSHEERNGQPAGDVQAEENDHHSTHLANDELIIKQELSERRRRGAEGDEDSRESGNKGTRMQ